MRPLRHLAAGRARRGARLGERHSPLRGAVHRRRPSATCGWVDLPRASARRSRIRWCSRRRASCVFVEFFADKIPGVDSVWDVVHTFIRIPAGAALAASVFGDSPPACDAGRGDPRRHAGGGQPFRQGRQPRGDQHVAGAVLELGGVVRRGPRWSATLLWLAFAYPLAALSSCWRCWSRLTIWLMPKLWRFIRGDDRADSALVRRGRGRPDA